MWDEKLLFAFAFSDEEKIRWLDVASLRDFHSQKFLASCKSSRWLLREWQSWFAEIFFEWFSLIRDENPPWSFSSAFAWLWRATRAFLVIIVPWHDALWLLIDCVWEAHHRSWKFSCSHQKAQRMCSIIESFSPFCHFQPMQQFYDIMKTEEKNNSQKVRIAVLGNMNVGKSGKLLDFLWFRRSRKFIFAIKASAKLLYQVGRLKFSHFFRASNWLYCELIIEQLTFLTFS